MKQTYFYPKTEVVQLNGCSIMVGSKDTTPMDPPSADPFEAPLRNIGKMYI